MRKPIELKPSDFTFANYIYYLELDGIQIVYANFLHEPCQIWIISDIFKIDIEAERNNLQAACDKINMIIKKLFNAISKEAL
jgi:hypothetical protein